MGIYLNPDNSNYSRLLNSKIVVDKSLLIEKINAILNTVSMNICVSRPRRFGKSTDANMLVAYYSKGCDSQELFQHLKISQTQNYGKHLNQHNVIHLDIQKFLSITHNIDELVAKINYQVIKELKREYAEYCTEENLSEVLNEIFAYTQNSFVFIIDEWDCIFREYKNDTESQKQYLDYLRLLLKEQPYVELCYMTGILPIKKYGTHSALNMFDEISMVQPESFSEFMGFTEKEVKELCNQYHVDFNQMKEWYDGYHLKNNISIYSPRSVTASIQSKEFNNYWSQTETFEALRDYINLNVDGLKDDIIALLTGERRIINIRTFQNDMSSFASKDDILTLLIHLGYLGYDSLNKEIYIPNHEVKNTFIDSISTSSWGTIQKVFQNSNQLLQSTWKMDSQRVSQYIEEAHYETSILQYNDENALEYTIYLAYITAKDYYTVVRELPTGKGYADIVFIPKTDKPAMIIELKYNQEVETGISQIKNKNYPKGLENYLDNLLLVSINYDKETKEHQCCIEKYNHQ